MRAGGIVRAMVVLLVLSSIGCGGARYVLKQPDGGVVAIPNNSNVWPSFYRKQAEDLMARHYPQGYLIEREEEVITGTVTTNQRNKDTDHFGPFTLQERTTDTTSSRDETEWRISYRPK